MAQYPECDGSVLLGTGCGYCLKCRQVLAEMKENKKDKSSPRPPNPPMCTHGKTMDQACTECNRGRMVS